MYRFYHNHEQYSNICNNCMPNFKEEEMPIPLRSPYAISGELFLLLWKYMHLPFMN